MKLFAPLILAGSCLPLLFAACTQPEQTGTAAETAVVASVDTPVTAAEPALSILYYFHRTLRCTECLSMELFAGALVASHYEELLLNDQLAYEIINLDEPEFAHYADKFNLTFSTLVLADVDDSGTVVRWEELDQAWEKSHDQEAFSTYVKDYITHWRQDT